jgi:hypothetical protein
VDIDWLLGIRGEIVVEVDFQSGRKRFEEKHTILGPWMDLG